MANNLSGSNTDVYRELPGLASKLERRYHGVSVDVAYISVTVDEGLRQHIQYRAPLQTLKHHGLVKDCMLSTKKNCGTTDLGDWFALRDWDSELCRSSKRGIWDLTVLTGASPIDWRRSPQTKKLQRIAIKLLTRFATGALGPAAMPRS